MDETRTFECKNDHVMGLITKNGKGTRRLLVYRYAIDKDHLEGADPPEVMGIVEGFYYGLRCSVCGAIRTYIPGEAEMINLIKNLLRGNKMSESDLALIIEKFEKDSTDESIMKELDQILAGYELAGVNIIKEQGVLVV